jgi:hypothetical protein
MADRRYLLVDQDIVCREEEWDDVLLFNPDTGKIKVVNPTAFFIWQLCDGTRTRTDVLQALADAYEGVTEEMLKRDLDAFLQELEDGGLIDHVEG